MDLATDARPQTVEGGTAPSGPSSTRLFLQFRPLWTSPAEEDQFPTKTADFSSDVDHIHDSTELCGRGTIIGLSPDGLTAKLVPLRCKSWRCAVCGPLKVRAWRERLTAGQPNREICLTRPPREGASLDEQLDEMKAAWSKLVQRIRRRWGPFEYALIWELTKAGTPHLHILARSGYIHQKWLSVAWSQLGEGSNVWITKVKNSSAHVAHVTKYLLKHAADTSKCFLNRRIIQASNGWDLQQDPDQNANPLTDWTWAWSGSSRDAILSQLKEETPGLSVTFDAIGVATLDYSPTLNRLDSFTDPETKEFSLATVSTPQEIRP